MSDETKKELFERGQKEGRDDAVLAEHGKHLERIELSLEKAVKAEEELAHEIRKLGTDTSIGLDKLEHELKLAILSVTNEVRLMQEEGRSDKVKVESARAAIAEQTERRRVELSDASQQGMTQRAKLTIALTVVALILTAMGLFLAYH